MSDLYKRLMLGRTKQETIHPDTLVIHAYKVDPIYNCITQRDHKAEQEIIEAIGGVEQLQQDLLEVYKALESLTPGGSEFYHDIEKCVQWVKERQNSQHEIITNKRAEDLATQNLNIGIEFLNVKNKLEAAEKERDEYKQQVVMIETELIKAWTATNGDYWCCPREKAKINVDGDYCHNECPARKLCDIALNGDKNG